MTRFAPAPRVVLLLAALTLPAALSACVGLAVGGAATVGLAGYDERGIDGVANDLKIAMDIRARWLDKDANIPVKASVEVNEGRALLTGLVPNEKMRADAVGEAYKVIGVKQVLNEIQVAPSTGAVDFSRDAWVTTQIKSKLTFDEKVMAVNFHVETVNGTVYLIGIARTAGERDQVVNISRGIGYVRRVVDHIRVKDAAAPKEPKS